MEEDRQQKYSCKICNKRFPCGRSLGGHMRSHFITISSYNPHKADKNIPKNKLPPPANKKSSVKTGLSMENPKKPNKSLKSIEEDTLLREKKSCKECGKSFQSWKALFGHMKCHSVNGRTATNSNLEEDNSWSDHDQKLVIMDSQSDNDSSTPLCRRKISDRMKRCKTATDNTNSSSLTVANLSDHFDQQEQEEVALSLIILSRDKGDWNGFNFVSEYSENSSDQFLEAHKITKDLGNDMKGDDSGECLKMIKNEKQSKTRKVEASADDDSCLVDKLEKNKHVFRCNESEVNSPRNPIKKSGFDQLFEADFKKNKSRKRKSISASDSELGQDLKSESKFSCSICKKGFSSYQALGGHRASHKKFNGSCAPNVKGTENTLKTEKSHNRSGGEINLINGVCATRDEREVGWRREKEHECPICFRVFQSGQALGGHKRSHLINISDQSKTNIIMALETHNKMVRKFLDLNLPAPDEEECNELKPW